MEVLRLLAPGTKDISAEAHFATIDSARAFARLHPEPRFTFYGWAPVTDSGFFSAVELDRLESARLVFGTRSVHVSAELDPLPSDWDGCPSTSKEVSLAETFAEPVGNENRQPSAALALSFSRVVEAVTGKLPQVQTSTAMTGESRQHIYIVSVSGNVLSAVLRRICDDYGTNRGLGSFEFLADCETVEALYRLNKYRIHDFPEGCWSFNAIGRTPFAFERDSFIKPVLNLGVDKLTEAGALIDSYRGAIPLYSIVRRYLSWTLGGNQYAHNRGNYMLLLKRDSAYTLSIGLDEKSDNKVRAFKTAILRVLRPLGATIEVE
jgi:hypothetical protein